MTARGIVERRTRRDVIRVEKPEQVVIDKLPPPVTFPPDAARPCDAGIALPELVREVKPEYTQAAMRALLQGKVFLEAIVSADGSVAGSRVLHGFDVDRGLHAEAISAVNKWRFKPGTASGRPVPVIVTIEMLFTLK